MESIKIGEDYLDKLLSSRMLKGHPAGDTAKIAAKFARGYTYHSFCISLEES